MNTRHDKTEAEVTSGGGRRRSLWKGPASVAALVVLITSLGNRFVDGWNWPLRAFFLVGTLVFLTGLTYELITRNVDSIAYRAAVAVALAAGFVLVWMNFVQLADGVDSAAAMFFGVPLVGIVGAAMARFRPDGMVRALFATAIAQAVVLATVLMILNSRFASLARPFGLNAFLLILFLGSALLFRTAARQESAAGAE